MKVELEKILHTQAGVSALCILEEFGVNFTLRMYV